VKYVCPNNPEHTKFRTGLVAKLSEGSPLQASPHYARLDCDECGRAGFIKWLSKKEYEGITQGVPEEDDAEEVPICPMPLRYMTACMGLRCAWWFHMDDCCSVLRIAEALSNANERDRS